MQYKTGAIISAAREVAGALNPDWLTVGTLVPVPPSKIRGDPLFDDRLERVCARILKPDGRPVDSREIVRQSQSIITAHTTLARPGVDDLLAVYSIDDALCDPAPVSIGIFDDVLTAGTHYRAMHTLLRMRFPSVPIVGIFIARRVFPPAELDEGEPTLGF